MLKLAVLTLTALATFTAASAHAEDAAALIARGQNYDRAAEKARLDKIDRDIKQAEDDFQRRGGTMPVRSCEAEGLNRAGLGSQGAYFQSSRQKNGRYGGSSVLMLANGMYCTSEDIGFLDRVFTCRQRNGAPVASFEVDYDRCE